MDAQVEKLRSRLAEIDELIRKLEDEASDIEIALRVIEKYAPAEMETKSDGGRGAARPNGLPTLFEMVTYVLRDAESNGLTSSEIVAKIRARYWPGLISSQIMPSVYRFVKEKRLGKRGDKFHLLPKAGKQEAVLELTGEAASSNGV